MIDILALDIATVTGFARGNADPCTMPIAGSVRFGQPGASDSAIFAACLKWLSEQLEPRPRPDWLVLEAMLPPGAKLGATSRSVRDRLAGLHGIVRAVAFLRGVFDISIYAVGDVRAHFIGDRTLKRERAKWATVERCQALGWNVTDDNAADAAALWSYAVSLIRPEQALKVSPLFNKQLRVTS